MEKLYEVVIGDSADQAEPSTGWMMWNVLVQRTVLRNVNIMPGEAITVAHQRLLK